MDVDCHTMLSQMCFEIDIKRAAFEQLATGGKTFNDVTTHTRYLQVRERAVVLV